MWLYGLDRLEAAYVGVNATRIDLADGKVVRSDL
jgi:hypothetical protein